VVGVGAEPRKALELARTLLAAVSGAAIVIVAEILEPELVSFVLDEGISGLLLTDAPGREVAACLDQVANGRAVLPSGWHGALVADRNDPLDALSERQMQVLMLLADGCSYEEIGARLFITLNTVKFHVRSIFQRLGVGNRMAAARVLSNRHARSSHKWAATEVRGHAGSATAARDRTSPSARRAGHPPANVVHLCASLPVDAGPRPSLSSRQQDRPWRGVSSRFCPIGGTTGDPGRPGRAERGRRPRPPHRRKGSN
jgi:DNA-binding NarL/FixJ family response regulator